jgi:hypothetical protein
MTIETSGELLQRLGTDAQKWADELIKRWPSIPKDEAIGWCANMIMAGYDQSTNEKRNDT